MKITNHTPYGNLENYSCRYSRRCHNCSNLFNYKRLNQWIMNEQHAQNRELVLHNWINGSIPILLNLNEVKSCREIEFNRI